MILPILLLATTLPSASLVSWMQPEAFHLRLGMTRKQVLEVLRRDGWTASPAGSGSEELVVSLDDQKRFALTFASQRLRSVRFELVAPISAAKLAFSEEREFLTKRFGAPLAPAPPNTLIYEKSTPNVIAVLSVDPSTDYGRQGFGFLVVRYFRPPPR